MCGVHQCVISHQQGNSLSLEKVMFKPIVQPLFAKRTFTSYTRLAAAMSDTSTYKFNHTMLRVKDVSMISPNTTTTYHLYHTYPLEQSHTDCPPHVAEAIRQILRASGHEAHQQAREP